MTIVNLAQDYVGSNNLNLLLPNGQYGTRDQGGKDMENTVGSKYAKFRIYAVEGASP